MYESVWYIIMIILYSLATPLYHVYRVFRKNEPMHYGGVWWGAPEDMYPPHTRYPDTTFSRCHNLVFHVMTCWFTNLDWPTSEFWKNFLCFLVDLQINVKPHCIWCSHFKVDDISALEPSSKPPVRIVEDDVAASLHQQRTPWPWLQPGCHDKVTWIC
jgi:hypothetical protein